MKFEKIDRIYVTCIYNCGYPQLLDLVFDTGAAVTTVGSDFLEELTTHPTGRQFEFETANKSKVLLNEIKVMQFTVGDIDMGCCCIWTGPSVGNLLGMDLLSKLNWEYSPEAKYLEIRRPVVTCESASAAYVRKFCMNHNISFDTLVDTFPDSWENLGMSEIENLTSFAYNTIRRS